MEDLGMRHLEAIVQELHEDWVEGSTKMDRCIIWWKLVEGIEDWRLESNSWAATAVDFGDDALSEEGT